MLGVVPPAREVLCATDPHLNHAPLTRKGGKRRRGSDLSGGDYVCAPDANLDGAPLQQREAGRVAQAFWWDVLGLGQRSPSGGHPYIFIIITNYGR